jgi:hypothetical protein
MGAGEFTAKIHKEDGKMTFEPGSIFRMGSPAVVAGLGLRIGQGYDAAGAPVGIYFDDGGVPLTQWGEGFTVGTVVTVASEGTAQTGWPYTAFFYTDVEANINSAVNQHWPTLMTSFIVGTGKTLRGFTIGASSHHASVDVNGTLYAGSTLSCVSFGGNWPGTVNGTIVCLDVRPTNQLWSAFLKLATGTGGAYQDATAGTDVHKYLKVYIGTKLYTITMDAAT